MTEVAFETEYGAERNSGLDKVRAARRLNLDPNSLTKLLEAGVIGRPRGERHGRKGAIRWLITEQDVVAFQNRLKAAIRPSVNVNADRLIPLRIIAGGKYLHGLDYTALIEAVLRGELVPRGQHRALRGAAGLLFDPIEVIRYCASHSVAGQGQVTIAQAAKPTGLQYNHIRAAIDHSLLDAQRCSGAQRSTYRLTLDDVEEFGKAFTTPAKLAAKYGRNPRFIMAALSAAGIEPVLSNPSGFNGVCFYANEHLLERDLYKLFEEPRSP